MCKKIFNSLKRWVLRRKFLGEINNKLFTKPIIINSKKFGKSTMYPSVLEIEVSQDSKSKLLDNVGKIVHDKYFDFDFLFNVCFSCSKPKFFHSDNYADPYSIWFNVFLGYYQLDIPFSQREYPFGFNENFNEDVDYKLKINPKEVLEIGKSDWNYFSNFLYGVPLEYINENVTDITQDEIEASIVEKETIGDKTYYKLTVPSFKVITPYQAKNSKKLNREKINLVWQTVFGFPVSRKEFTESFIPVNMKAIMYIYYKDMKTDIDLPEGEKQHSTFIFGATINLDYPKNASKNKKNKKTLSQLEKENEEFLELQLKEVKKIIPKIMKH